MLTPIAEEVEAREMNDWRAGKPTQALELAIRTFADRAAAEVDDAREAMRDTGASSDSRGHEQLGRTGRCRGIGTAMGRIPAVLPRDPRAGGPAVRAGAASLDGAQ